MLEGLQDAKEALEKRHIKLVVRHESPELAVVALAKNACCVIVDAGHTGIQRKWRRYAGKNIECSLEEVETNLIVPVTEVSDKENFSAGTLRPRINKKLPEYLIPVNHKKPKYSSLGNRSVMGGYPFAGKQTSIYPKNPFFSVVMRFCCSLNSYPVL